MTRHTFPILFQFLLASTILLNSEASFGPFGKWKVQDANSYIIYNGIYIPNPQEMIDPNQILDSLNPVSSFNKFWKSMPSFSFPGSGGGDYGNQYSPYSPPQYNQYSPPYDQYADPSTLSASYQSPEASGSETISSIASPEDTPAIPASSSALGSFANLFGFGSSTPTEIEPEAEPVPTPVSEAEPPSEDTTEFAAEDPSSTDSGIRSGLSSYLPWNWFRSNSRSGNTNPLGNNNQIPAEFQFLMSTPFQINRRNSDGHPTIEQPSDHVHNADKEKVSVYYKPVGQGSYLRYEVHEPIENPTVSSNSQPNQRTGRSSRIKRSATERAANSKERAKQFIPKLRTASLSTATPSTISGVTNRTPASKEDIRKKNAAKYNRRRYLQLQKQKQRLSQANSRSSTLLSKFQKYKKSDTVETATKTPMLNLDEEFPCPKVGFWSYNGEVCIALGPVPKWACKPNDLVASGKLVVCRNKILMS